ncbi:MAG: hypothetical protein A3J06_03945 [Candidatus Moranbacteria bacterium RIFCSPLOWO2_02_FULL_48_19]|nr:MAG: hypothetical protein A3J06_03945 [Candidatus Moranbacteria bacterium RIFCSPLOWO2_02_FULL_48_19]OGI29850.1 MAG: hypothetical protein A3G09_00980 [Candidatus Moranbacteria bacterium RIFCSPLOWO2_12_FULL_48_12]
MKKLGSVQKKALILLLGGAALSFAYSPKQSFRIIGMMKREWKKVNKQSLENAIRRLYDSQLIDMKQGKNENWEILLTKKGKHRALLYNFETYKIKKPLLWDKKWRVVLFDIPEKEKALRDAFRGWLKRLNFYKLQASVFVHPYDCRDEFDFLVEFYRARKYVRFMVAEEIDNEPYLRTIFSL